MQSVKNSLKIIGWNLLGIISFFILYIISALSISMISVNSDVSQKDKPIEIFILSNGVHTDIVVPIKNEIKDWSKEIRFHQTKSKDSLVNYLAFGWGDKGFYLNTSEWSDLKAITAFNAAFGLSSSAMHTTFYKKMNENASCKKIKISSQEYQKLITYISESFKLDSDQNVQWISGNSYGNRDAFYEANGSYNLFFTCNTWANNALKTANQKASLWTVTDTGIFCQYQ
ncbi:TIGR02117 family protein [Flavobacterium alvei]|uniref:TIGR02117 family protein n=1 Tax=Flavobacterium alvei TaxID=2080416 RepID=A0A2S5AE13_9FLAO|nr:TIGR02117 family protein [Flavobacterium alvei]POY40804.1 TIGR02117 family protein [Flavobacterium alvei]